MSNVKRSDGNGNGIGAFAAADLAREVNETRRSEQGQGAILDNFAKSLEGIAGKVSRLFMDSKELLLNEVDNLKRIEPKLNDAVDAAAKKKREVEERLEALRAESKEKEELAQTEKTLMTSDAANAATHRAAGVGYMKQKDMIDKQIDLAEAAVLDASGKYDKTVSTRETVIGAAREKISKAKEAIDRESGGQTDKEIADALNSVSSMLGFSSIDDLTAQVNSKAIAGEVALEEALKRSEPAQEQKTRQAASSMAAEAAFDALGKAP